MENLSGKLLAGLCILTFELIMCLYYLLQSPSILRMNKKKNTCTKETKYRWQKKYKIKNLCKLSDLKRAVKKGKIWTFPSFYRLRLELKSGKNITLFWTPAHFFPNYIDDFYDMEDNINAFLNQNDKELVIEHSLVILGILHLSALIILFLFLLFIRCY